MQIRTIPEILKTMSEAVSVKRVFIIGSAFVDVVIRVPAMPASGSDLEGECRQTSVGGCSFNVADVLAKLSLPFDALMPVGEGMIADIIAREFSARGYPLRTYSGRGDNGWCLALVEPHGERTFVSMFGIERRMSLEWFDAFPIESFDLIYASGYQAEGENGAVLLEALKRKRPDADLIFDPGPRAMEMTRDRLDAFLSMGTIAAVNASEARAMTNTGSAEAAGRALSRKTGRPAVVTDGARGAVLADGDDVRLIPGFPVDVVDTIGSGDSHTGGFIAARMCGLPLEECVLFANAVASVVTGREGAAAAPTAAELRALHQSV